MNHNPEPPFPRLFVSVVGYSKRVYTSQAPARAFISGSFDPVVLRNQGRKVFGADCSLWSLSEDGWTLLFQGNEGDSHDSIPWKRGR